MVQYSKLTDFKVPLGLFGAWREWREWRLTWVLKLCGLGKSLQNICIKGVDRSSGGDRPSEIFHPGVNDVTMLIAMWRLKRIKDFSSSRVATIWGSTVCDVTSLVTFFYLDLGKDWTKLENVPGSTLRTHTEWSVAARCGVGAVTSLVTSMLRDSRINGVFFPFVCFPVLELQYGKKSPKFWILHDFLVLIHQ